MRVNQVIMAIMSTLLATQYHAAASSSELAKVVIIQMQSARERISNCGYQLNISYDRTSPEQHSLVNGEWRQMGTSKWYSFHRVVGDFSEDTTIFIGDLESGLFDHRATNASQFNHDDPAHPGDREKAIIYGHFAYDIQLFGYGLGDSLLSSVDSPSTVPITWDAYQTDLQNADYILERTVHFASGSRKDIRLEVNSQKGWMVTHSTFHDSPTHLLRDTSVDAGYLQDPQLFYPRHIHMTEFAHGNDIHSTLDITVHSFTLTTWPKEQFTPAAMKIPDGRHLVAVSADGKMKSYVVEKSALREFIRPKPVLRDADVPLFKLRTTVLAVVITITAILVPYYYLRTLKKE